jgi:hypothetical protein
MGYSNFKKLNQLTGLGIQNISQDWLPVLKKSFEPSQHILSDLLEAKEEGLASEKAKSEYLIAPILKEVRRKNPDKFKSFSGYEFDVDSEKDLTGFCDFILSLSAHRVEISAPIFCLVEAKKGDVEEGFAQCGAEMYAAQIFNEREGNPKKQIFGCVTNAFSWCFLKLENKNLYIDPNYVPLTFTKPHEVLAVLQWILDESLKK